MHFIQGSSRSQTHLFPVSLEEAIAEDNEVRIVDLFVTSNRRNILANPQLYKKRQAIVEHSYGTIKRQ